MRRSTIAILLALFAAGHTEATEASTQDGPCIFPFKYKGHLYQTCTTDDDTEPWCATEVDGFGEMDDWKYCYSQSPEGSAEANTCSTSNGRPCIFPFKVRRGDNFREYTTCTTADGDAQPWCATKVNDNGQMMEWAHCNSECPGVAGTNNMIVHPDNAVGNCKCGVPNAMSATRIVGGMEAQIGEYPWQVALLFSDHPDSQGCGGTLVSDRYVITAAHCTAESSASRLKVLIGDTNFAIANDTTRFIASVAEIRQHPDYNSRNTDNDIAVLVLTTPVDLAAYPNIKPACLPDTETVDDLVGEQAVVSGWGTVGSGQHLNGHLHEVTVEVFAKSNCGAHTSRMTENMMCAGLMEGGKDSCQGDSGGPLVAKNNDDNNGAATLVGVVSWGFGCADVNAPGVYADVAHFVKSGWLSSVLTDLETCPPPASSDWFPGSTSSGPPPSPTTTSPPDPITMPPPSAGCMEEGSMPGTYLKKYNKFKTSSKQKCYTRCMDDPDCEYWTLQRRGRGSPNCRLYKMKMVKSSKFISGRKHCIDRANEHPTPSLSAECKETVSVPVERLAFYRKIQQVWDEQECHSYCMDDPDCEYWAWKTRSDYHCRLYGVEMVTNLNFITGSRFCSSKDEPYMLA